MCKEITKFPLHKECEANKIAWYASVVRHCAARDCVWFPAWPALQLSLDGPQSVGTRQHAVTVMVLSASQVTVRQCFCSWHCC